MVNRFAIPGFAAWSYVISRPVSVTAERIFFADRAGSSSRSMIPLGEDADLDIFAVGSWRSVILAAEPVMYGAGTVNVDPYVVLNRCARSRVSSRC